MSRVPVNVRLHDVASGQGERGEGVIAEFGQSNDLWLVLSGLATFGQSIFGQSIFGIHFWPIRFVVVVVVVVVVSECVFNACISTT